MIYKKQLLLLIQNINNRNDCDPDNHDYPNNHWTCSECIMYKFYDKQKKSCLGVTYNETKQDAIKLYIKKYGLKQTKIDLLEILI